MPSEDIGAPRHSSKLGGLYVETIGVPLVQKSTTDGLVYKTYAQSEQASPSAEAGPEWNAWVEAHLEAHDRVLTDSIGQALAHERQLRRTEAEKELAPVRRELAELQGQVSVLLTLLGGTKADVVPLTGAQKLNAP